MNYYFAFLDVKLIDSGSPSRSISIILLSRFHSALMSMSYVNILMSVEGIIAVICVVSCFDYLSESRKLSFHIPLSSHPAHLFTDC